MKKITAIMIVAAMAFSANAVTLSWGTSAVRVQFPTGTTVGDGSALGYLVYLGNTGSETYTISDYMVTDPESNTKASTIGGLGNGRIAGNFVTAANAALPGTSDLMVNGAVFGMYIVKDGWINISSSTYTVAGLVDDSSSIAGAVFAFSWEQNAPGVAATSGGGWATPVPEPATAALALAGLAMLIRRRK